MSDWFTLPHLTGCRITGPDAEAFCQAQLTSDVAAIPPDCWQLSAWCNRKGRVRMLMLVARHSDHIDIVFPEAQAALLDALALFKIGRQVEFTKPFPIHARLTDALRLATDGQIPLACLRLGRPESDCPIDPDRERQWARVEIQQRVLWLGGATQDRFLPQALGLEDHAGLSYQKGCYPGQEVVARVHYLGKPPQKLITLTTDGIEVPIPSGPFNWPGTGPGGKPVTALAATRLTEQPILLAVGSSELQPGDPVEVEAGGDGLRGEVTTRDFLC